MALSRPLLLALLGVALLGATVFAVQNARNSGADDAAPVAQKAADSGSAPAPSTPEQSSSAGPQELLRAGLTPDALESASFEGSLSFSSRGDRNVIRTSGAFELGGAKEMPKLDVQVSLDVPGFDGRGGFVTTGDRAWLTRGGTGYAVPQDSWSQIVKARESGAAPAAQASKLDLDPSSWLRNVKSEGTEQMDGVQVTHVSADVNSARALADVVKAMDSTGAVPKNAEAQLAKQIDDGHIEAWVGEDQILRRASLDMSGKSSGGRRVSMNLDFTLSQVNKPQQIEAPSKVKHSLPSGAYGQLATGFVAGLGNTVGVTPDDLRLGVPVTNSHVKAERAVADNKKVVVLTDDVRNSDRYGTLLEDLQVSQAPAIVVIGRSGKAELIEGYVDADSLVQVVADAR